MAKITVLGVFICKLWLSVYYLLNELLAGLTCGAYQGNFHGDPELEMRVRATELLMQFPTRKGLLYFQDIRCDMGLRSTVNRWIASFNRIEQLLRDKQELTAILFLFPSCKHVHLLDRVSSLSPMQSRPKTKLHQMNNVWQKNRFFKTISFCSDGHRKFI